MLGDDAVLCGIGEHDLGDARGVFEQMKRVAQFQKASIAASLGPSKAPK
jgi:hypothetical protein